MLQRIPRSFPPEFPIVQFPNRSALVAFAAGAVSRTTDGRLARDAAVVSHVASLVWAYGEITDGANWVRRLFGVGGGVYAIAGLVGLPLASQRAAD